MRLFLVVIEILAPKTEITKPTRKWSIFETGALTSRSGGIQLLLPCCCSAPLPLPASLHQHAWLPGRQHMHTFWRRWLAGQRCRCWREGAPGRIPVGRRYVCDLNVAMCVINTLLCVRPTRCYVWDQHVAMCAINMAVSMEWCWETVFWPEQKCEAIRKKKLEEAKQRYKEEQKKKHEEELLQKDKEKKKREESQRAMDEW